MNNNESGSSVSSLDQPKQRPVRYYTSSQHFVDQRVKLQNDLQRNILEMRKQAEQENRMREQQMRDQMARLQQLSMNAQKRRNQVIHKLKEIKSPKSTKESEKEKKPDLIQNPTSTTEKKANMLALMKFVLQERIKKQQKAKGEDTDLTRGGGGDTSQSTQGPNAFLLGSFSNFLGQKLNQARQTTTTGQISLQAGNRRVTAKDIDLRNIGSPSGGRTPKAILKMNVGGMTQLNKALKTLMPPQGLMGQKRGLTPTNKDNANPKNITAYLRSRQSALQQPVAGAGKKLRVGGVKFENPSSSSSSSSDPTQSLTQIRVTSGFDNTKKRTTLDRRRLSPDKRTRTTAFQDFINTPKKTMGHTSDMDPPIVSAKSRANADLAEAQQVMKDQGILSFKTFLGDKMESSHDTSVTDKNCPKKRMKKKKKGELVKQILSRVGKTSIEIDRSYEKPVFKNKIISSPTEINKYDFFYQGQSYTIRSPPKLAAQRRMTTIRFSGERYFDGLHTKKRESLDQDSPPYNRDLVATDLPKRLKQLAPVYSREPELKKSQISWNSHKNVLNSFSKQPKRKDSAAGGQVKTKHPLQMASSQFKCTPSSSVNKTPNSPKSPNTFVMKKPGHAPLTAKASAIRIGEQHHSESQGTTAKVRNRFHRAEAHDKVSSFKKMMGGLSSSKQKASDKQPLSPGENPEKRVSLLRERQKFIYHIKPRLKQFKQQRELRRKLAKTIVHETEISKSMNLRKYMDGEREKHLASIGFYDRRSSGERSQTQELQAMLQAMSRGRSKRRRKIRTQIENPVVAQSWQPTSQTPHLPPPTQGTSTLDFSAETGQNLNLNFVQRLPHQSAVTQSQVISSGHPSQTIVSNYSPKIKFQTSELGNCSSGRLSGSPELKLPRHFIGSRADARIQGYSTQVGNPLQSGHMTKSLTLQQIVNEQVRNRRSDYSSQNFTKQPLKTLDQKPDDEFSVEEPLQVALDSPKQAALDLEEGHRQNLHSDLVIQNYLRQVLEL